MRLGTLLAVFWLLTACSSGSDLPADKYLVAISACKLLDSKTVDDLTMHPPKLSTESRDEGPEDTGTTSSSCRMQSEDATRTYWVSIQSVRYMARDGVSGAERARKRLGGTNNDGFDGLECVYADGGTWGTKSAEARDGNVILSIEYGASPKQGAEHMDAKQHGEGLRRVIEDAATGLELYKNA
jgi:hypothetical protein